MTSTTSVGWSLISPHISFEVHELAIKNGVHMLKLPPHLTHLLHLLHGVFKPMKANWYSAVAEFTRRERRGLTKREFLEVLSTVWKKYNPQTATGGFKGCGIHPYDDSVIPHQYSKSTPNHSVHHLNIHHMK